MLEILKLIITNIRGANLKQQVQCETPYKMNEWLENMNFQLKNSNSDIEKIKIFLNII